MISPSQILIRICQVIVVVVLLPLTWRSISVDTDVDAYRRADSQTARNHLVPGSPGEKSQGFMEQFMGLFI